MRILHELGSPLIRRALVEAILVGAVCGAIGVHVLLRRLSFFSLAIAHSAFPGVAIASVLGVELFIGGAVSALLLIAAVAAVGSARRLDNATATGVALSGAFAVGVIVQSARAGASQDLTAFLVGDILTVRTTDLVVTAVALVAVVAFLVAAHRPLVFAAFDPSGAEAAGLPVRRLELALLVAIAAAVVASVVAVGTILVVTLLVAPALAARQWTDRIGLAMAAASALGVVAGAVGIAISAQWGVAGGAAITLAAVGEVIISVAARSATTPRLPTHSLAQK